MTTFVKGAFHTYRAVTSIHLGQTQTNLSEGEEVEYDGYVLRHAGVDTAMHTLRGAIKAGWLVPLDSDVQEYVPQPAGVKIHRADGSKDRSQVNAPTVAQDDQDLGSLQKVRPVNAPRTHKASRASELADPDDGVVVGRLKTPAKFSALTVGTDDQKIVNDLSSVTGSLKTPLVERVNPKPTMSSSADAEELQSLVPDAHVAKVPVTPTKKVAAAPPAVDPLDLIRQFIPGFEWDTSPQWKQRAKIAVDKWGHIPAVLNYIVSVETDAVREEIQKRLAQ